ncbi:hypothetical protein F5I97DRAFT_1861246 [Phlebopus sp. FC_14]|nr:hypothetical protein F5I97DRAFT_1861246 [Phlebopus sp. FC_14]
MLGTRTKQVFAYGRRGQRVVNISDRQDRESGRERCENPSGDSAKRTEKRENTVFVSPSRPALQRRTKRTSSSPVALPAPTKKKSRSKGTGGITKKPIRPRFGPSTPTRQPLTPFRPNCTSPNVLPFTSQKTSKPTTVKPVRRASLKPQSPLVAVDIIVIDENGGTVSQERRLSHPDIQTNPARTAKDFSGKFSKDVQPIIVSDDSELEEFPLKHPAKRPKKRCPVIISSDESEQECERVPRQNKGSIPNRSLSRTTSLRVEVLIPPPPWKAPKLPSPPCIDTSIQLSTPKSVFTLVPSLIPPPLPKTRQLTPIRGSATRAGFRRPLPTPPTPTDLDLSLELANLGISGSTDPDDLSFALPEYLVPLLKECSQTCPYEFSAFIETFPFDPVVQSLNADEDTNFRKIGEASFSEVFGIGDVVLKIIPIQNEEDTIHQDAAEFPATSDARHVLKEIIVTREIGEICNGFVKLLKTYVVRGRYPSLLLDLWDEYNERKGSESTRPDSFGLAQVYVIIVLPNGGPDLESFTFPHASKGAWLQACGVFWQVARALGQAEKLANFEHRDLHWGQILVKSVAAKRPKKLLNPTMKLPMDDAGSGVKVTIIDLGLSRMDAEDGLGARVYWTPFDEEIFEGEGDYQYDVYRMMRDLSRGPKEGYQPFTNVMWLHYLATKLLHSKRLKPPGTRRKAMGEVTAITTTFYDDQECYDCLVEMERLLAHCIKSRKGRNGRRKTVALAVGLKSAADVVNYAVQQGWLRASAQ